MKEEAPINCVTNMTPFIFILPTWLPTYESKNIGKILKYLQVNKYRVTVYCGPTDHSELFYSAFPEFILLAKREVYRWPNLIGHVKHFYQLATMVKKCNGNSPIFWTYAGYRENIFLILLKKIIGLRIIVKNDSQILTGTKSLWGRLRDWFIYGLPATEADGVISETPEVYDNWNKYYSGIKRHFIYSNGVDIATLKSSLELFKRAHIGKNNNILMSGRLNNEKGVDLAVEAFCKIAPLYPEWRLTLVGEIYNDESYSKACELAKEFGVEERISWLPFCKGIDLYKNYYSSSIFLNTSRNEGLPNRFIEAMYFRCAVLSFDIGQCKYLLSSNRGIIVENGNLEVFIENLSKLIENQETRSSLGRRASEFIELSFNDELNLPILVQWMSGNTETGSERKCSL